MVKVILLLIYLYGVPAPELVVEQHVYDTDEACRAAAGKRTDALVKDPKFVGGYFAGCIEANVTEAKK